MLDNFCQGRLRANESEKVSPITCTMEPCNRWLNHAFGGAPSRDRPLPFGSSLPPCGARHADCVLVLRLGGGSLPPLVQVLQPLAQVLQPLAGVLQPLCSRLAFLLRRIEKNAVLTGLLFKSMLPTAPAQPSIVQTCLLLVVAWPGRDGPLEHQLAAGNVGESKNIKHRPWKSNWIVVNTSE